MFPLKFIEKIHNYEITLDEARNYQTELRILINKLNNDYNQRNLKKLKEKNNVLESARELLNARKDIIGFFEKAAFPYKGNAFKTKEKNQKKNQKILLKKNQKKKESKNLSNILRMNQMA